MRSRVCVSLKVRIMISLFRYVHDNHMGKGWACGCEICVKNQISSKQSFLDLGRILILISLKTYARKRMVNEKIGVLAGAHYVTNVHDWFNYRGLNDS